MAEYNFNLPVQLEALLDMLLNGSEQCSIEPVHISEALDQCSINLNELACKMQILSRVLRDKDCKASFEAIDYDDGTFFHIALKTEDPETTTILNEAVKCGVLSNFDDSLYCEE